MNDGEQEESMHRGSLSTVLRWDSPHQHHQGPVFSHAFLRDIADHFLQSLRVSRIWILIKRTQGLQRNFWSPADDFSFENVQFSMKIILPSGSPALAVPLSPVKKRKVSSNDLFCPTTTNGRGKSLNHLFSSENSHGTFWEIYEWKAPELMQNR